MGHIQTATFTAWEGFRVRAVLWACQHYFRYLTFVFHPKVSSPVKNICRRQLQGGFFYDLQRPVSGRPSLCLVIVAFSAALSLFLYYIRPTWWYLGRCQTVGVSRGCKYESWISLALNSNGAQQDRASDILLSPQWPDLYLSPTLKLYALWTINLGQKTSVWKEGSDIKEQLMAVCFIM